MMRRSTVLLMTPCLVALLSAGSAAAQQTGAGAQANAAGQASLEGAYGGGSSDFTANYSIRAGVEAAGPLMFRDTPDALSEETSVFAIGPRVGFLLGSELANVHRAGIGFSYLPAARSESRKLTFIPIYLMYETGHPLILQLRAGANLAGGTEGFKDNYGGFHAGMALRYSFLRQENWSPVSVSPGLLAFTNLSSESMQYSSAFLGIQIEVAYNTNN
jgi:hypothetical protein